MAEIQIHPSENKSCSFVVGLKEVDGVLQIFLTDFDWKGDVHSFPEPWEYDLPFGLPVKTNAVGYLVYNSRVQDYEVFVDEMRKESGIYIPYPFEADPDRNKLCMLFSLRIPPNASSFGEVDGECIHMTKYDPKKPR